MLIKEKDFRTFEWVIKESIVYPRRRYFEQTWMMFKKGKLSYRHLYNNMNYLIKGGFSSFKTMEELASQIERDAWYLHNYGDAKYWENNNNNRNDKNGKDKNNNTLSRG